MPKKQMIALFTLVIFTSLVVSTTTIIGGVWYLKKASQDTNDFWSNTPLSFLSQEKATVIPPTFHELDKVVLSVKGKRQTHFVMLEIAIETRRPERIQNIDNYMPVVRNALLKLFSDKTYDDLRQDGSVDLLQNQVKQTVLLALENTDLVEEIDDVLLTKYVVQ
jgi:flagellar FliL protein